MCSLVSIELPDYRKDLLAIVAIEKDDRLVILEHCCIVLITPPWNVNALNAALQQLAADVELHRSWAQDACAVHIEDTLRQTVQEAPT